MNTMRLAKQHTAVYSDAILPVGTDCVYFAYSLTGFKK